MILGKHLVQNQLHRTCSVRVIIHPDYFSLGSIFGVSASPGHGGDAHFSCFYYVSQFIHDDFFYNHHTYHDATSVLSFQGDIHYPLTACQALWSHSMHTVSCDAYNSLLSYHYCTHFADEGAEAEKALAACHSFTATQ